MSHWQPRHTRLLLVALALASAGIAAALVLAGLSQKVTYFYAPADIAAKSEQLLAEGKNIRLGGMVEKGSVKKDGLLLRFRVTDFAETLEVSYEGQPPDLFREGQGVVAEGVLQDAGHFKAHTLLAKHDEKYMPPEVARSLKNGALKMENRP